MNSFLDALAEQGISAIVGAILMGLLAGGAALLAQRWVRRGKVWVKGDEGHTRMSPFVLLVALLCGAMAAACLLLGLLDPRSLQERGQFIAWAGLVGGFSLACLLILPYARQAWDWDGNGLRWRGAWRTVSIPWCGIKRAGKTWGGQTFVADERGTKICWSSYTLKHEALRDAVARQRPDITVPAP
jgi:hypothetical protein